MAGIRRLFFADSSRKSRFHDSNGRLHLNPEMFRAATSSVLRAVFGIYPNLPWLTYPAIRQLQKLVPGASVFEFGSGSSTRWFSDHSDNIVSVENNIEWIKRVKDALSGNNNVELIEAKTKEDMISSLKGRDKFSLYLIDCQAQDSWMLSTEKLRIECLNAAVSHSSGNAIYIIDNTDVYKDLAKHVELIFSGKKIQRLSGWVPGSGHPNETTIVYGHP